MGNNTELLELRGDTDPEHTTHKNGHPANEQDFEREETHT